MVVRAPPDGYTLSFGANNQFARRSTTSSLHFLRDITASSIIRGPRIHRSRPRPSLSIAYAKANPGKINMASPGIGTSPHVAGELFKMMAGIDMVHVPYRSPPLSDLIAGQVQVYFGTTPASIEYIRAGKVRALAVTGATRSEVLPEIPTVNEFVPGYEASFWFGIGAPKNTPAEIVKRVTDEIVPPSPIPKSGARLADRRDGAQVYPPTFNKLIADETEKWGKVIRAYTISSGYALKSLVAANVLSPISNIRP
jgi:hypothetical protein